MFAIGCSTPNTEPVAEGTCMAGGELSIGKNLVTAYVPFEGFNFEDGIVISERCVREDILTSVHLTEVSVELSDEQIICDNVIGSPWQLEHLKNGLVKEGTWVEEGDVLVAIKKIATKKEYDRRVRQGKSLLKWQEERTGAFTDSSSRVPVGLSGRVVYAHVSEASKAGAKREITIMISTQSRVQVGDKLAGRHGNKGIVAVIVDDRDMPYLPDGTPVDICLNPLGVPSRMNVGQIFETLLGTAARWTGQEYRVGPFDEMFAEEASRSLVFDALRRARERTGYKWIFDPQCPGKTRIFDGRTGLPLDQPVCVGVSYILKLYHMVSNKIHTRSWGKYSSITQQPNKGRKAAGGQRLGEMEVSALVGYGAHATLQEMITIKSDDLYGRDQVKKAMLRGEAIELPIGGTAEGYLTFQRELASTGIALSEGTIGGS
mmetsp:Transcript_95214/g.251520  ORF Transcript_95214/g.251520 Transcript_95214/m.251520 type:complete len:432 (-) Transcript_95214:171-1466(-)